MSFLEEFATDLKKDLTGKSIKTAIEELGSDAAYMYPFEIAPIDILFGGGIAAGKIYEFFGWESMGKSTLGLEASKCFTRYWSKQKEDNYAVLWIETESALDKLRAKWMGCAIERFLIAEAETVEDGFDIIEKSLIKCKAKKMKLFIVWDKLLSPYLVING